MSSLPADKPASREVLEWSQCRFERFEQDHPADNRNDVQELGNLSHPGPLSILKNHLN